MKPQLVSSDSATARAAFELARGVAGLSRSWGQVGLGTIFKALKRLPPLREARGSVKFMPGSVFETEFFEPYWGPTIVGGRAYEPEVMAAMKRLAGLSRTFIDCGANYGFWSIVATSPEMGFSRTLAVEASPLTFERLRANAAHNDNRFACVNRAIGDSAGKTVFIDEGAGHVRAFVGDTGTGVTSATIDSLVQEAGWLDGEPVVLKIDVEGQECAAIRGAEHLMSGAEHVWIFEDFASIELETVGLLLGLGYSTYYLRPDGRCVALSSVASGLGALKSDRRPGNARNFAAAKPGSAFHAALASWSSDTSS